MTVGGSTIGSATSVSTAGASRHRVVLSQCASGSPSMPRTSVVMAASRNVSQSDCQSGAGRPRKLETDSANGQVHYNNCGGERSEEWSGRSRRAHLSFLQSPGRRGAFQAPFGGWATAAPVVGHPRRSTYSSARRRLWQRIAEVTQNFLRGFAAKEFEVLFRGRVSRAATRQHRSVIK